MILKKLGIDWEKKDYEEFYLITDGEDKRASISKILKKSGGKPNKSFSLADFDIHGDKSGYPEYIIEIKKKKVVLIVECKSNEDKHKSKDFDNLFIRPADYNLDGVLYYSRYFKENFTVLFLAVTGDVEKEKEWLISFGIWKQGANDYKEIINKITKEKKVLTWKNYFQRLEENADIRKIAKELNDLLRVLKFGNKEKPLFIGSCLLALRDDDFFKKVSDANFDKEEDIPNLLKNALNSRKSLGVEEYNLLKKKLQELISSNKHLQIGQTKKTHRLSSILKKIQEDIYPLIKTFRTDIIGEFYHEFLRYTGSDGKGLGIVLTPSHIAELFCDIVKLKSSDKVLDICCGTGTFLVVALQKVNEEEFKKNLYGVESDPEIYYLLWINMILHGDGSSNIHHTSCFDEKKKIEEEKIEPLLKEVKFTVGFLNPPYSQKDYNEAKFMLHLLNFLERGKKAVVITHLKVARGTKMGKERRKLLEKHKLEAVMTMPKDLFYGNKSNPSTCIMVWTTHESHEGKTWLASWKDDGFVVKDNNRKEKIEGVSWKEKKKEWLENYSKQKEDTYTSKLELIELKPNEKQHKQSWLPEFYLPVDYSQVKERHFMESLRDYLGYIMANSISQNQFSSFSKLVQELDNKPPYSLSLNTNEWEYFPITSLFTSKAANQTNFRVDDGKKIKEDKEDVPLISTSKKNNGCVGYVKLIRWEKMTEGNCISFSSFGGFFYQPDNFYRSYARDGNVWCLRADWLNEKRGLFIGSLLTNAYAEKFHYGWQINGKNIHDLKIKLPIKENKEVDWEFMEKYIEYIINRLSLSLSLSGDTIFTKISEIKIPRFLENQRKLSFKGIHEIITNNYGCDISKEIYNLTFKNYGSSVNLGS